MPSNLAVWAESTTRWRMPPRSRRSVRSAGLSSRVEGTSTAPSLMQASSTSQRGRTLSSMTSTPSPRLTPKSRRALATWLLRWLISWKETLVSPPPSSTIQRAGFSFPAAITSK